jgi:hypothetical protein
MIWSAGKKRLIELTAAEERAIIVPTRCDETELLALADAAKEAAQVLRERAKQAKTEPSS